MLEAYISEIQHFCVHDGPGIRTTVFFQGCPLRCKWCQNPETISMTPVLMYNKELCRGCETCSKDVVQCYFGAKKMSSVKKTVDEVYEEVIKEEVMYSNSGGGITLSGGEPLMQKEFCISLLERFYKQGISTAVETAGFIAWETFDQIRDITSTFLYDLKLYTKEKHLSWTSVSNDIIKDNLRKLTDIHDNVVVRIPLIPNVNDTDEEFRLMIKFISGLRHINSVHILPFHKIGAGKYELIGVEFEMDDTTEENEDRVNACKDMAESFGLKVSVGGTGFVEDKIT